MLIFIIAKMINLGEFSIKISDYGDIA